MLMLLIFASKLILKHAEHEEALLSPAVKICLAALLYKLLVSSTPSGTCL